MLYFKMHAGPFLERQSRWPDEAGGWRCYFLVATGKGHYVNVQDTSPEHEVRQRHLLQLLQEAYKAIHSRSHQRDRIEKTLGPAFSVVTTIAKADRTSTPWCCVPLLQHPHLLPSG